jgi:hypothetical protein
MSITHRNRSKTHNTTPLAKTSQVFLPTGAATLTFSPFLTARYTPPFLLLLPLPLPDLFFSSIAIHLFTWLTSRLNYDLSWWSMAVFSTPTPDSRTSHDYKLSHDISSLSTRAFESINSTSNTPTLYLSTSTN